MINQTTLTDHENGFLGNPETQKFLTVTFDALDLAVVLHFGQFIVLIL